MNACGINGAPLHMSFRTHPKFSQAQGANPSASRRGSSMLPLYNLPAVSVKPSISHAVRVGGLPVFAVHGRKSELPSQAVHVRFEVGDAGLSGLYLFVEASNQRVILVAEWSLRVTD